MADTPFTDSYIETDTELETLIGADPRAAAVALKALAAASQEWYCQEATRHIDSSLLRGTKYNPYQDLAFPRIIDGKVVGDLYRVPIIPEDVKRACAEEAITIYQSVSSGGDRQALQDAGVQSFSIGGKLQETFVTGAGKETLRSLRARQIMRKYAGAEVR